MQEFLEANKLRLILRSHEGPDARCGRDDLPDMSQGFTIDHVTPAGSLLTVFSAPDYPQFQVCDMVMVSPARAILYGHLPGARSCLQPCTMFDSMDAQQTLRKGKQHVDQWQELTRAMHVQAEGQERYQNLGAVAVLKGPQWDDPEFVQFEAVHPRPDVAATYEVSLCLAIMPPSHTA